MPFLRLTCGYQLVVNIFNLLCSNALDLLFRICRLVPFLHLTCALFDFYRKGRKHIYAEACRRIAVGFKLVVYLADAAVVLVDVAECFHRAGN